MIHNEPGTMLINYDQINNATNGNKRYFEPLGSAMTGQSIVVEESPLIPLVPNTYRSSNLEDYLKAFLGRTVDVVLLPDREPSSRTGVLTAVGDNFIVLQPKIHAELTVFNLNSISYIDIQP